MDPEVGSENEDDDSFINVDEIIKQSPEEDLRDQKLEKIMEIVEKMTNKMAESTSKRPCVFHPELNNFLDGIRDIISATEFPKPMDEEDYIILLDPPTDNEDYLKAVKNLEDQVAKRANCDVPLKCPVDKDCKYLHPNRDHAMQHIRIKKHLNLALFACKGCKQKCSTNRALQYHIKSAHFDYKYPCEVCQKKHKTEPHLNVHESLGHVQPFGKKVFLSSSPGQIRRRKYKMKDSLASNGGVNQQIVIPWVNKKGKVKDWSIGYTRASNIKQVVKKLWRKIKNECEKDKMNVKWVETCGSAKEQLRKGLKMKASLAFSLEMYGVGDIVSSQLKWYTRRYYNSVHILATKESEYFLSRFNDKIKEKLNSFRDKMPKKIRDYVDEFGESFAM